MGIAFKLVSPATSAGNISGTIKKLNLLRAAIEEYHAEYGIYPPATATIGSSDQAYEEFGPLKVSGCGAAPGAAFAYVMPMATSVRATKEDKYSFGLLSFLVDRRVSNGILQAIYKGESTEFIYRDFWNGSHWGKNGKALKNAVTLGKLYGELEPSDRDSHFFARVLPYVLEAAGASSVEAMNAHDKMLGNMSDCYYFTIHDAWDQDFVYICPPPHTSYALFSAGPDHMCVASDPLNRGAKCPTCGQYHNRDNVYASVGDR